VRKRETMRDKIYKLRDRQEAHKAALAEEEARTAARRK
jgi:hypothetical protein